MNEAEAFFSRISPGERDEERFFEDLIFLAVHEWHFTPEETLNTEIPMIYLLLKKQNEFNKDLNKR